MSQESTVLESLLRDPTRSVREIAKNQGSYGQKVWREKKRLEEEDVIWGYTAVVDEAKLNQVLYVITLKLKPLSKEMTDLIMKRVRERDGHRRAVRLINVLYVNGEYDSVIMFSAENDFEARRYYDSLRLDYEDYLLEKPVMMEVILNLVREGKVNPNIEKLYEFIPNQN
jgi:DNA-binding Lrp family transcriptional regulator